MTPPSPPTQPATPDSHTPAEPPGATSPTRAIEGAAGTARPASGCLASERGLGYPETDLAGKSPLEDVRRLWRHQQTLGIPPREYYGNPSTWLPASVELPAESPSVAEGAD